jgi:hypothetical protein
MLFMLFVFSLMTFKDLAAHLEKFGGTLVRHGTPFEKHSNRQMICSNTCNMKEIKKGIRNYTKIKYFSIKKASEESRELTIKQIKQ